MLFLLDSDWRTIKRLVFIVGAIGGLIYFLDHFNILGLKNAKVVALNQPQIPRPQQVQQPEKEPFLPDKNRSSTAVPIRNKHENEGLIQAVSFRLTSPNKPTPNRSPMMGAAPADIIDVHFHAGDYDQNAKVFYLPFRVPIRLAGHETAILDIAIIEPDWEGTTYTGTITVLFDGGEKTEIENVELDSLPKTPPKRQSP